MSSDPLVTVVIPTYNRRELLVDALNSVLDQTYKNVEIVIADDGSTDGTADYVRSLVSDKIRYVAIDHQGHPGATRNAALKVAQGEFVAFLDSDDWWFPSKIETQLRAFANDPDLDLVATDFYRSPSDMDRAVLGLDQPAVVTIRGLLRANPIQNSSVMIRRRTVEAIGLQDETLSTCQDYEYWLRVLRRNDRSALILAEPLTVYRRHETNHSQQDVDQCDRLSTIVARHRDYDEPYIDSLLVDLQKRKAFRQALVDLDEGHASLVSALRRKGITPLDKLRLIRHRFRAADQSMAARG